MLGTLANFGSYILNGLRGIGSTAVLLLNVLRWLTRVIPDRQVLSWQLYFIGAQSLPVILTTGAFTGMVLAYNAFFEFKQLGVQSWVGPLVAESLVEQLGPVLAGLMLAGRVGGSMAAELGTMAVTEQLDALKTMGTDPVKYLVAPRVLACTIITPLLTAFATATGIVAGFGLAIYGLGANGHFMWIQTLKFVTPYDFFSGFVKAAFFGCSIALICCYKGMNTRGGAEGVGRATTEANVASCITILIGNMFLTMVLMLAEPFATEGANWVRHLFIK